MSKILLVGGAGYVGAVLAEELLERGYAVKILDRLYYGKDGLRNIEDRVEVVVGDMRSIKPDILDGVTGVVNLGGLSNDPTAEYNPTANHEMNTIATRMMAEMCKKAGVSRYVFASSCSIYDRGVSQESQDVLLDEEAEVNPRAAYSSSKFAAERFLLEMVDENFCPVILRKGTIYGFSPRMRFDLVVNTFVKDAMMKGVLTLHYGGEMWRPLVDVRDAARAYIAALEAPEKNVRGEIFNISYRNFRISEVALRVREGLRDVGVQTDIRPDYGYKGVRNYRVSGEKTKQTLQITPQIGIEESVINLVEKIREYGYTDFDNPKYYNIRWMRTLEEAHQVIQVTGSVFGS